MPPCHLVVLHDLLSFSRKGSNVIFKLVRLPAHSTWNYYDLLVTTIYPLNVTNQLCRVSAYFRNHLTFKFQSSSVCFDVRVRWRGVVQYSCQHFFAVNVFSRSNSTSSLPCTLPMPWLALVKWALHQTRWPWWTLHSRWGNRVSLGWLWNICWSIIGFLNATEFVVCLQHHIRNEMDLFFFRWSYQFVFFRMARARGKILEIIKLLPILPI